MIFYDLKKLVTLAVMTNNSYVRKGAESIANNRSRDIDN